MANHPGSTQRQAPILIVHNSQPIRKMLQEVLALEGYVVQETDQADKALRSLQAAEDGMIVYFEPIYLLHMRGAEGLRDYVMERDPHNPHVFLLLDAVPRIPANTALFRADGALAVPFTVPQLLASVEDAQRLLQTKRA